MTIPKTILWADYQRELDAVKDGQAVMKTELRKAIMRGIEEFKALPPEEKRRQLNETVQEVLSSEPSGFCLAFGANDILRYVKRKS